MLFIISVFLLAVGPGGAEAWQKLTCPVEEQHRGLRMVWCRRTSSDCCFGVSFGPGAGLLDGGRLNVTRRPDSFTVEVLEPNPREGLYWCGGTAGNGTVVKLAERHIYSCIDIIDIRIDLPTTTLQNQTQRLLWWCERTEERKGGQTDRL